MKSNFFTPEVAMTRAEFTKGVIRACDIRSSMGDDKNKNRGRSRRKEPPEESPFKDVKVEDVDYQYIKQGLEKNIIAGVSKDLFNPEGHLTRDQAVTILIRALGRVALAVITSFDDENP